MLTFHSNVAIPVVEPRVSARAPAWNHVLALLPPLAALAIQWTFWSYIQPFSWFLFYPAVFFSSWIGGRSGGLAATILSTLLVVYFFIPPAFTFAVANPRTLASIGVFLGMGILFSVFHGRLREANRLAAAALATARAAKERLEARVRERTAELERINVSLGENDELFAKAFRLSPGCMNIVRLSDRTVLRANEALCRLWGSTPDEVVGKPSRDFTTWLDDSEREAYMRRLHEKGECLDYETTLRLGDGRLVPFSLSSRAITLQGEACVLSIMHDITERRRAESATQVISAIVECSDDAIIGKDLHGVITSWNPGAENIFGYTAAEVLGTSITRLIPPERQAEEDRILAQVARGEPVRHFETVRLRKDGRRVDISVTVSPIRDAGGRVVGASKIARDISERKRGEAAMRESNERFASMFHSNPVATSLTTAQGRYLNVNDAFLRMFQWSREEVVGRTVADLNIWMDPARRAALFAALGRHGGVQDFEMELRAKSGEVIQVSWSGVQLELEGESCLLGSALDITKRKRDEAEIRRLNAELEQRVAERTAELADLYNHAPCGYHSLDAEGRFVGINDTELEWLGYARDEIVGKLRATDLMTPQSAETFRQSFPGFKASGRLENLELALVRKDGSTLPVLLSATAATDPEGRFVRSRSTIIDYSARQRAEQALEESRRQLLATNHELEAFSYSVSHDLRTPLRAVDGFSQAVLEDFGPQLPPEGRRQLQTIRESAQRMGTLIDDLLALSKLSRQPLRRQTVVTAAVVRSVLGELELPRDGRRIEFKVGDLPDCQGDPALLRQVWLNLLANAVKYTGKQPSPVVEIGSRPEPGGTVYHVRDNGAGFDMRYAHKLFGVFQRLHRQEDYAGTGVGLAIVQRIVHRHGGRIWAEAAVDRGATFYFTLQGETNP